jgi:site-specific DNA recombinase
MFLALELDMAKKNNDDLSDQVRDSFIEKRSHGEYPGPAPLGYINAILGPKTRNIAPDPLKAPLVIECFKFASHDMHTLDDVWRYAVDIGLLSRNDKPISKQTLQDMLQRRAYTGVFKYGGEEWHKGTYEPLISVELFDKVQLAMGWAKSRSSQPSTTSGRFYPYKGLILCGACQFNITAYTKHKKLADGTHADYEFYTCTKKSKVVACKEPQVSAKELEASISTTLANYELSESDANECKIWLEQLFNSHVKKQNKHKPMWLLEQQKARAALDVLDEKLELGTITDARYKMRAEKHEATLARTARLLEGASSNAEAWLELSKEVFSSVVNIGEVFQSANDQERRELMKYIGSNWYLSNKKVVLSEREPLHLLRNVRNNHIWRARPDSNRRSPP